MRTFRLVVFASFGALLLGILPVVTPPNADAKPVAPKVTKIPLMTPSAKDVQARSAQLGSQKVDSLLTREFETQPFRIVGVTWTATGAGEPPRIEARVRERGTWTDWSALATDDAQADEGSPDAQHAAGRQATEPLVVNDADALQVRVSEATSPPATPEGAGAEAALPPDLEAIVIDPGRSDADEPRRAALSQAGAFPSQPGIVSRAQWGADESLRACPPSVASTIQAGIVHHTVSTNSYGPADSAGLVRGIYAYHVQGRGWCDIGYNFLVDKFGQIFEGRYGGIHQPVIGAHTGGFNTNTFGVSLIGNYSTAVPSSVMLGSLQQVLAWKLNLHGRDPQGTTQLTSAGGDNSKYPAGQVVTFNVISGHLDAAFTECPGDNVYPRLPEIRVAVAGISSPIGNLDGAGWAGPGRVRMYGWSIDPTTVDPIQVHAWDGARSFALPSNLHRGDVGNAFPMYGPNHGFDSVIEVGGGRHTFCVYGINVGPGFTRSVGCRTIDVPQGNPVGNLESTGWAGPGLASVRGWALDFDTAQSIQVHVWVDGTRAYALNADRWRPDVAAIYPAYGPWRGFEGVVPTGPGTHSVCAYAINVWVGSNTLVNCATVNVPGGDPTGAVDSMARVGSGVVRVSGWSIDFDSYAPTQVHVWVDGARGFPTTADRSRPDVAALWPAYGDRRGFSLDVTASPGTHQVCVYAINLGAGVNRLLQCRTVGF